MVAAFAPISDTLLRRRRRIGKSTVNGVMYVTLKVFNGTLHSEVDPEFGTVI